MELVVLVLVLALDLEREMIRKVYDSVESDGSRISVWIMDKLAGEGPRSSDRAVDIDMVIRL